MGRAHPRSRGENRWVASEMLDPWGSSPLTRGKRASTCSVTRSWGLIPAHAGKTLSIARRSEVSEAHPRSRGENFATKRRFFCLAGSSPLTRGKRRHLQAIPHTPGLIPAHAGKTVEVHVGDRECGAHPRSRGENGCPARAAALHTGSSPLTRGKLSAARWKASRPRLIPAHAGKTAGRLARSRRWWAHPRSRGENRPQRIADTDRPGSSPLTRGKRRDHPRRPRRRRLIPAHAGKTSTPMSTWRSGRAHPRSRGENVAVCVVAGVGVGSSPLTRGKLRSWAACPIGPRLIPAHAGKTCRRRLTARTGQAHPRSRGENLIWSLPDATAGGSSPLTRGKQRRRSRRPQRAGLIPAHAGKTCRCRSWPRRPRAHPRSRGENM